MIKKHAKRTAHYSLNILKFIIGFVISLLLLVGNIAMLLLQLLYTPIRIVVKSTERWIHKPRIN